MTSTFVCARRRTDAARSGCGSSARGVAPGKVHDLRTLPRELILQLRVNPNLSLGGGYRAYPGFTAPQIRQKMGAGW